MDKKSINRGKQLKLAREYRGLTQKELCDQIPKLSQSKLSKYEHGFHNQLSDEIVSHIMNFLDWPLGWLDRKHPEPESSWDY